ncbi:RNA-binding protein [Colwellia sp. 1_MG-2023]|jgi:RNA recognition motif-containing protein|uniref:RNA recognition motif domain-containing protein n=1 Tax=unclassified Colwellia TaxID=196834 RepID=UPI001C0A582C|nr:MULTISPECIES: RNA-binding protein [unclassified Colwellia]MBU2924877.1 RNA-binding protein [Colwellia sp. C2M11]MDO6654195.1 RNA-binding protein [Colwellia sp. 3_MG-2023]MDO6667229.1 RNA-binding protein [Colwellia sp. 2_MG-2023]MDO6691590.1 RNA-binding protein [Colwellia sp. 1_MG-2023]
MKSPNISAIVIAAIFAIIAFLVFSYISAVTPLLIAVFVFVSLLIASLINSPASKDNPSVSSDTENNTNDLKTLYVGNLPYRANETAVRELFSTYGHVESVRLMKDKHTGKRRGFGFVEMSASDLEKAITALNDAEFEQRTLKVREAKERPEKVETKD